jgi:hypothetical protein
MDLFNSGPVILGDDKKYNFSEMLQIQSKNLYDLGHVKTAINVKRPVRVSVILGS